MDYIKIITKNDNLQNYYIKKIEKKKLLVI